MLAALFVSAAKVVSAASFCAVLLAAGPVEPGSGEKPPRKVAAQQRPRTVRAAAPPSTPVARLTNDSLAGQPFGEEPTVRELLQAGGRVAARRPFKNVYEAGQIDTILLVRHLGNVFEFYRAPEKDLLRNATITNFQPTYGRRLRTRLEPACRAAATATDKVRIGDTERTNYVSVIYQGGQLRAVRVEPYLE
ncbi:hypothetical protein HNQ93_001052 [Hymenobacter luteus]|uniref:Uncharacterized protein n=2 Tax=Hymenobacter TaxID=89966 RepID=A0A7W9WC13_9BACT|nr:MULTISPECIES: hypothetical protein [Hymenobacter]MBB4599468.1 hypothetical protein [Hymenobacter latericoloratus]MBB6058222.1 hypothetical protein [Hymenobacter luteus]